MTENFERYLKLLGIRRGEPSIAELEQIVYAHMTKVPFENISKLYYLRTIGLREIPGLTQFLDGLEHYNFGGTCYANNFYLHQLLRFLGYNVELCGADMSQEDAHLINLVRIEGREFIADVGYAAPFLKPLPRDLSTDYKISLGSDKYILSPMDAAKRSQLTQFRDGIPHHGYLVNPSPRDIEEFTHVIATSYRPEATFMNSLLLVRFSTDYSQVLHNMTFIESRGMSVRRKTHRTTGELIAAIEEIFAIPSSISRVALEGLSMR